jgi:hypothetical protein
MDNKPVVALPLTPAAQRRFEMLEAILTHYVAGKYEVTTEQMAEIIFAITFIYITGNAEGYTLQNVCASAVVQVMGKQKMPGS